jgi:protein-disulfide isomerase
MRLSTDRWLIVTLFLVLIAHLSVSPEMPPAHGELEPGSPSELGALKDELERIKTTLEGIQKELALIRQYLPQHLSQPPRPAGGAAKNLSDILSAAQQGSQPSRTAGAAVKVSISGDPMLGSKAAPVTLIEFSDYQCPFCRKFFATTLPALKTEYIDTGKVRYVFRDFPLDRGHPQARKAAEASHCAGEQGKYWEMHELLFHNQKALQLEHLKAYARRLSLDASAFDACLEQGKYAAAVQKDVEEGTAAGVQGTPGFFLGKTQPDDTVQGIAIKGAQPITAFRQAIDRLLGEN